MKLENTKHLASFNYYFRSLITQFSIIFRGWKHHFSQKYKEIHKTSLLEGPKIAQTQYKQYCWVKYDHNKLFLIYKYIKTLKYSLENVTTN